MTDFRHVEFTRKAECKKEFSTEVLEVLEDANKRFVELVLKNICIWIRLKETNVVSKTRRNTLGEDDRILEEKQNVKYYDKTSANETSVELVVEVVEGF